MKNILLILVLAVSGCSPAIQPEAGTPAEKITNLITVTCIPKVQWDHGDVADQNGNMFTALVVRHIYHTGSGQRTEDSRNPT